MNVNIISRGSKFASKDMMRSRLGLLGLATITRWGDFEVSDV